MDLGLKKKQAQIALESFFDAILDALKAGKKVTIVGLGAWQWKIREPRRARNPKTGKTLRLKKHFVLSFTPAPLFKKKLNP